MHHISLCRQKIAHCLTVFSTVETILSLMDARHLRPLLNKAQILVIKRTYAHWLCV